ncbi:MAG: Crp/Fnr family transcriptional regulator [Roseivirga sp.]|nr:Crp/Fnr family transcriptional regulator [Roseivirga sp.]
MQNLDDLIPENTKTSSKHYKKGEILQSKGDQNPNTYYVKNGLLRSYIIDSKGKEHIFMFAPENWIIADVESLEFDQPAELFIDCIEDTEILIFDRAALLKGEINKELINQNLKLLYRRMGMLQRRIIMQMSAPAIDRYHYFLDTYPELPNRVPQHMIASYLGITPQALSTIRSKNIKHTTS